jgi:hypothetical protein
MPYFDLRTFLTDTASTGIGTALAALLIWLATRDWFRGELAKIKWQQSGNVWWLACDLHSIKGHADLDSGPQRMLKDIDQALHHASSIAMDHFVISRLEKLRDSYVGKATFESGDKDQIHREVNALTDYCGNLAAKNQPDYKPRRNPS